MYQLVSFLFILFFLFFAEVATSTSLVGKYQYLNAENLPRKLWLFGVAHTQTKGSDSYAHNGNSVSNKDYFSRTLNYSNLLDEVNDPLEKELARAAFASYGKHDQEIAGRVVNEVSVSQKSDSYILGRGLSDTSSFFVIFPVVTIRTQFSSRFVPSPSLHQLTAQLKQDGQFAKAREINNKSQNALRESLENNHYNTQYPSEVTSLANVYLNYRLQPIKRAEYKLASDSFLIVPAGKKFSENEFLPIRINEEQFGFKQAFTGQWSPNEDASFLAAIFYHKRFPFTKSQRIPKNAVSFISPDTDPQTRVRYGDAWGINIQTNWQYSDALTMYVGQLMEYKLSDSYQGSRYSQERYDYLELNTSQQLGTGYLGASFNTVQYFLANNFPIPMDLNLQYSFSNTGKNTFRNQTIALNMLVFYQ